MIYKLISYPIRVPSMSSTCVCAACTALRQAGRLLAPTSTIAWVNGNSHLAPLHLPSPGIPLSLLPPPVCPQSTTENSRVPSDPCPHARVGWIPSQAALFNPRRTKTNSDTPTFKNTAFFFFTKLPLELRVRIWAFSVPKPRVIELRTWKSNQEFAPLKISAGPHLVPSILHVNHESRTEGLRIYHLEEIGVSTWKDFDSSRIYIPWRYHPANRFSDPEYMVHSSQNTSPVGLIAGTQEFPRRGLPPEDGVMPYAPQRIYLDYSRDIIYLGPEFSPKFLESFLSSPAPFLELPNVQYLGLDRSLWLCQESRGSLHALKEALYTLRKRPVREVYIIPDDAPGPLSDRWYYGKHELVLMEPAFKYEFSPAGQSELAKTAVENLNEWIERLWTSNTLTASEGGSSQEAPRSQTLVPKVSIKSVRRAGRSMSDYKEGVWQFQKSLGNMSRWKTWVPPAEAEGGCGDDTFDRD